MAKKNSIDLNYLIEETNILKRAKTALIKNNIVNIAQLVEFSKKQLKDIKGLSSLGIASIEIFLKENGLSLKKEVYKKDENLEFKKIMVSKFLKPENINWAKEMRIAQTILSKYPDKNIWKNLFLPFKLNSLFFFLTQKGQEFLKPKREKYIPHVSKNETKIGEQKLGEDIIINKPKTIKDFLNGI